MDQLKGKVAIITGAAGDIGRETVKLYMDEGAKVLAVDRDADALTALAATHKSDALATHAADVTSAADTAAYVKAATSAFGRIDILFANAGVEGAVTPITDYPEDMFDTVMAINVKGPFLGIKAVMPVMAANGGGSIMITSSVAGLSGSPGISAYCTSKHAVIGLMRTAALEGGALGIRCNTIHPSPVEGRMMSALEHGLNPEDHDAVKEQMLTRLPLGRYATPVEIANMALFLGSDRSSFCTGNTYVVDGGMKAS